MSSGDPKAPTTNSNAPSRAATRGMGRAVHDETQAHDHPDNDVLFAKAQELGVPLAIHVSPWHYSREVEPRAISPVSAENMVSQLTDVLA